MYKINKKNILQLFLSVQIQWRGVVGKSIWENRIGKLQNTNGNKCAHAEVKWKREGKRGKGDKKGKWKWKQT